MATPMVLDPKALELAPSRANQFSVDLSLSSSSDNEEDLYTRLKSLQCQLEFIEIQEEYVKLAVDIKTVLSQLMDRLSTYASSSPEVLPKFLRVEAFTKLSSTIWKVDVLFELIKGLIKDLDGADTYEVHTKSQKTECCIHFLRITTSWFSCVFIALLGMFDQFWLIVFSYFCLMHLILSWCKLLQYNS